MFHLQLAFVSYMYDIVVGTQFHKFYGRRSRVFNIDMFLMKCIFTGQWLPWLLPRSTTGWFWRAAYNRSAHGYYITRKEGGGVRCAWSCYMIPGINRVEHCHPYTSNWWYWGATSIPAVGNLRCIMEYGCVYSFVGRRSTTAETTAAAAHLGVTTYMFFSHIRTRYFSEGSVQQHPPC